MESVFEFFEKRGKIANGPVFQKHYDCGFKPKFRRF